MSNIPNDLRFTATHEWVKQEDDGTVIIGITDHAQNLLGDLVFVELPEIGTQVKAGDEVGVVESVKAASDFYSPITGEVTDINEVVQDSPEVVNSSPYDDGWLFKVMPDDAEELNELLDADGYQDQVDKESH